MLIVGCDTLTAFIYGQVDGTYIHNIESFVDKVCMLAHKTGDEQEKRGLRASSLRCLSAMVWFMTEFSHVFADSEKVRRCIDKVLVLMLKILAVSDEKIET